MLNWTVEPEWIKELRLKYSPSDAPDKSAAAPSQFLHELIFTLALQ